MNTKQYFTVIAILVISLVISGCGAGQLFGPTVTPSPTSTSTLTSTPLPTATLAPTETPIPTATLTPTNTPVPVESILLDKGFVFDASNTSAYCTDTKNPCKKYSYIRNNVMAATIYANGEFDLSWYPITGQTNTNKKLESVFQDIIHALYPTDLADAIINGENPRSGEIGGYKYSYSMSSIGIGDAISVSVIPIP